MRVTFGNQTMKIIGWQWWNYHTVQVSEKCLNLFGKELGEVQHIHHLHQLTRLNQKPNQHCRPLFSQCQVCFLRCQCTVNIFFPRFFLKCFTPLQKRVQNLLLMSYSLDILKPKTKTKNQNIFCWCKWKFDFE